MKTKKSILKPVSNPATHSGNSDDSLKDSISYGTQELGTLLGALNGELKFGLSQNLSQTQTLQNALQLSEKILLISKSLKLFSLLNGMDHEPKDLSQILLESMDSVEKDLLNSGTHLTVLAEAGISLRSNPEVLFTVFSQVALFSSALASELKSRDLHVSLKHNSTEIEVEFHLNAFCLEDSIATHLENPYALRDLAPHLSFLGLAFASAKAAVESHGGFIEVHASHNGTRFTIIFPCNETNSTAVPYAHKRQAKRVRTHLLCNAKLEVLGNLSGTVSIISTHGAYLKLENPKGLVAPKVHSDITLEIHLPGTNSIQVTRAKIANLHSSTSQVGIGIEFFEVEPKGRLILEEMVRCSIE